MLRGRVPVLWSRSPIVTLVKQALFTQNTRIKHSFLCKLYTRAKTRFCCADTAVFEMSSHHKCIEEHNLLVERLFCVRSISPGVLTPHAGWFAMSTQVERRSTAGGAACAEFIGRFPVAFECTRHPTCASSRTTRTCPHRFASFQNVQNTRNV